VNLNCQECGKEIEGNPNFCPTCGNKLKENSKDVKENFRKIETEDETFKHSDDVRKATTVLVLSLVLVLMLSILPIAKVTNSEEKYSAYYDEYLEKLEGSDAKAPRELIEDRDLEEIYLERIANSQMGLLIMIFYCIAVIGYNSLYRTNKNLDSCVNQLSKKIYIVLICYILYNSSCFVSLSFEHYVEKNGVIMPLISIIYLLYAITTLKIISNNSEKIEYNLTRYRLNYIFESSIFAIILIPMVPWICATYSDIENTDSLVYSDTSILAYNQSIFVIYELELLADNLSNIYLFLWSIVILSIVGEIGIFLNDIKKYKSPLTEFLSSSHNVITLLALVILYMHFIFFLNVEKLEEYVNEIANSGESNINYAFVPNYFSLLLSITILYQSMKLNYKEIKKYY
jgi:H+/gluconate symporter-like permease